MVTICRERPKVREAEWVTTVSWWAMSPDFRLLSLFRHSAQLCPEMNSFPGHCPVAMSPQVNPIQNQSEPCEDRKRTMKVEWAAHRGQHIGKSQKRFVEGREPETKESMRPFMKSLNSGRTNPFCWSEKSCSLWGGWYRNAGDLPWGAAWPVLDPGACVQTSSLHPTQALLTFPVAGGTLVR